MDLDSCITDAQSVWGPRYSEDEIKETISNLQLHTLFIDIMDFEPEKVEGYECVVVSDNFRQEEDTEEEDMRFFKKCDQLKESLTFARHQNIKYILLGDFGAAIKNMSERRI